MAHLLSNLQLQMLFFTTFLLIFSNLSPQIHALSFNFSSFEFNQTQINLEGDVAFSATTISLNSPSRDSVGRALYYEPMQLWEVNGNTTKLADFTSNFSFQISTVPGFTGSGHGLAFVLIKENYTFSRTSFGGLLGLFSSEDSAISNTIRNQFVAIEFDTYKNDWDRVSGNHTGINDNSIKSKNSTEVKEGFLDRGEVRVMVVYNSTTKKLSSSLTFTQDSVSYDVSTIIDLAIALPKRVRVGFTAATRTYVELHEINSWSFSSSIKAKSTPYDPPPQRQPTPPQGQPTPPIKQSNKTALVAGIAASLFGVILISGAAVYYICRSRSRKEVSLPQVHHIEYSGPKRFSYIDLKKATNQFDKELKLGEGGFGEVYKGKLAGSDDEVAVKRFKSGSTQGEKEFVSEVNVISMLRHKNLVQLKGWCHEKKELLLVYGFMPNRSLDFHLFSESLPLLGWADRFKIAVDLASALHYLQDGCDQFVLHRDIKPSNIMLDTKFNAKLGDFGLARLTNQGRDSRTTVPAGTLGYLAPEVISSGKVSKGSDIYSFGVVALELASGRRPINNIEDDPGELNLVEWVWDLYGKGTIFEAVDTRLNREINQDEARRLIVTGLWCCHPDPGLRPSIKQVLALLIFEAAEPSLPPTIPAITYASSSSSNKNTNLISSNASMENESRSSVAASLAYTSYNTNHV